MIKNKTEKFTQESNRKGVNTVASTGRTELEKYYEKGYLELINSRFSAEDRKKAGEMLAFDFYHGLPSHVRSVDFSAVRVSSGTRTDSETSLYYRERYLRAVNAVPREFWPAVRRVCIEDKKLSDGAAAGTGKLFNKNNSYHLKMLLNLGLDRLIEFYLKKTKKSS